MYTVILTLALCVFLLSVLLSKSIALGFVVSGCLSLMLSVLYKNRIHVKKYILSQKFIYTCLSGVLFICAAILSKQIILIILGLLFLGLFSNNRVVYYSFLTAFFLSCLFAFSFFYRKEYVELFANSAFYSIIICACVFVWEEIASKFVFSFLRLPFKDQIVNLQYVVHDKVENIKEIVKERLVLRHKQIQAIRFEVPSFKPRFVLPSLPHVHMPPVIFASTAPNATPLSPVSSVETIMPPKGKRFVDRVLEINDRINEVLFSNIKTAFSRVTMISLPKVTLPKISLPKVSFSDIGNGGRKGLDAILELNDKINAWFYGLIPASSVPVSSDIVRPKETSRFSLPKINITFDFRSRCVAFLREMKLYFVDFGLAVGDVLRDVIQTIVRIIKKGFVGLRSRVQLFFARRRESFARLNRELATLVEKSKQDTDRIINAYEEKLQKVKAPELSVQMPKLSVPWEIKNPFAGFSLPKIEVPKVEVPKIVFPRITNPFGFSAGYFSGGLIIGIIASVMLFIPHISIKLPAFKRPVFVAVKPLPTAVQKSIATPTPDVRPHMDVLAAVGSEGKDMSAVSDMVSVSSHQKQELGYYQTVLFYKQGEEHTAQMIAEKLSLSALLKEDESIESDLLLVFK